MDVADFEETKKDTKRFSDDSDELDSTLDTQQPQMQQQQHRQPPKEIITKAAKAKPTQQQDVQAMSMSMQGEAEASDLQCGTCRKTFKRKAHLKRHREQRDKPCEPPQQLTPDAKRRQQIQKARDKYQRSDKGKATIKAYAASSKRKQSHQRHDQGRKDDDDRKQ